MTPAGKLEAGRRPGVQPASVEVFSGTTVIAIDGSSLAVDAGRQALALAPGSGRIVAVTAWDLYPEADIDSTSGEMSRTHAEQAAIQAEEALREPAGSRAVAVRVLRGFATRVLVDTVRAESASLISVGIRHRGRAAGFMVGSVATEILHCAPCSVLAGRLEQRQAAGLIVVGVDGSDGAARALLAARQIARRCCAHLRLVAATGATSIDLDVIRAMPDGEELVIENGSAVRVLANAALEADLLVVGSRGLHGVRALGSVSERVAHTAPCSTLVVR